jgi:hypothetical protein
MVVKTMPPLATLSRSRRFSRLVAWEDHLFVGVAFLPRLTGGDAVAVKVLIAELLEPLDGRFFDHRLEAVTWPSSPLPPGRPLVLDRSRKSSRSTPHGAVAPSMSVLIDHDRDVPDAVE